MYATDRPFSSTRKPSVGPTWRTQRERTLALADREVVLAGVVEADVARQLVGRDREERRPHQLGEHLAERPSVLARPEHVERRALAVERREERKALHVIPVQVRQQHGAVELVRAAVGRTARRPVPRSKRIGGASSVSRATHDEWPPKRAYSGPAHGVEPRTPLNTTRIPPDMGGENTHAARVR